MLSAHCKPHTQNKGDSHAGVSPYLLFNFDGIERIYINAHSKHLCGNRFTFTGMRSGVPKLTAISRAPDRRRTESDHFPYHHWRLHLLKRQMSDSAALSDPFRESDPVWESPPVTVPTVQSLLLQPSCFIAAAHCFRTAPSSGWILCLLPYRNCIRISGMHG